ncbi:MAG: DUF61 family protein [Euryarchaeota archaeon]|nr:DUF61 family protein [Euryarchaeota archaeon]
MESFEKLLAMQLKALNRHLAKDKKSLARLLKEERPVVRLRDGTEQYFRREELEFLAGLLPGEMHRMLRLPIYIELSSARFGRGTSRVCGRAEVRVISTILEKEVDGDEMFVYRPEIPAIRKRLPTTTQFIFTTTLD